MQEGFNSPLERGAGLFGANELTLPTAKGKRLTKNKKITLMQLLKRATCKEKVLDMTRHQKKPPLGRPFWRS